MERIFDILDTEPKVKDLQGAVVLPKIKGDVSLREVTFSYDGKSNILERVNLEVKSGEMIAIVGPTGAGKTTIVSLLSRFYDINEGEIRIDGHNINQVTLKSLREQVGVMMQDTFLFSGEIIENIRFSKPEATDEECMEAARKVFADEFIQRLPEGYHTKIKSAASELSSGERQLLSFARLVLADPKIIILDEATSNIDTKTERKIQAMLKTVLKGRTSFIIAHRLSTIKNADRILYIEEKKIAECGNHEDLMKQRGKYYELVTSHSS
jgi:ATP-binding cassette subfamily B protein